MPPTVTRKIVFNPADRRSIEYAISQGRGIEKDLRKIGDEQVIDRTVSAVKTRVMEPLIRLLKVYPIKTDIGKLRWKSEKQRRYVLMLLTEQAKKEGRYPDIRYRRTRGMAEAWEYSVEYVKKRRVIRIVVENTAERLDKRTGKMVRISRFVIGDLGTGASRSSMARYRKPMQPFHVDRGWQPAAKDISVYVGQKAPEEAYERYEGLLRNIASKEYPV